MSGTAYPIGYGRGEIEPGIASLVDAVRQAGFDTFSSCEGHAEDADGSRSIPRFTSVAFYAREEKARSVHEFYMRYRDGLMCSWCFRGGFVLHRRTSVIVLGWTLENCGFIGEAADFADHVTRTVTAGRDTDIPILIAMFADIASSKAAGSAAEAAATAVGPSP